MDAAFLSRAYGALAATYGSQHWWPAADDDNPRFEILVGAMLTQHTAWTNVERALATLRRAGPLTPATLLDHPDLATLIRTAGPHNVKAKRLRALCEWFLAAGGFAALDGRDSEVLRKALLGINGIGAETADAILLYAFERPRFVADAYAFRVFERLGAYHGPRRYESLRKAVEAAAPNADAAFYNELHALIVVHAKRCCRKQRPACARCCLSDQCQFARNGGLPGA